MRITEPVLLRNYLINGQYNLWIKTNMPKLIVSENYFFQKQLYIHNNPTRRQYVNDVGDWYWSSANEQCELKVAPYF